MIPPSPDGLRQGRQSRRPFAKALQKRPMRMHRAVASHHPSNTNEREEHAKNARKKQGTQYMVLAGDILHTRYILQTAQLSKEQKKCTKLVMDQIKTGFKSSLQGLSTLGTLKTLQLNLRSKPIICIDFGLQKPDFKETKSIRPYSSNHVSMCCTFYMSLN